jgi:hypothetical protein
MLLVWHGSVRGGGCCLARQQCDIVFKYAVHPITEAPPKIFGSIAYRVNIVRSATHHVVPVMSAGIGKIRKPISALSDLGVHRLPQAPDGALEHLSGLIWSRNLIRPGTDVRIVPTIWADLTPIQHAQMRKLPALLLHGEARRLTQEAYATASCADHNRCRPTLLRKGMNMAWSYHGQVYTRVDERQGHVYIYLYVDHRGHRQTTLWRP